ncbi:N-acetyltransferase [Vallicoccus soli]|uniref:N-acetyltransferase n=1 Tax=Vallicoccus soli TaxID=2339232 RepID=A0A3A3ZK97_9ACTN|nr:N-acetyltransferase [Vallicoccus soli]
MRTARLLLRPWREEDRAPFAALNADAEVVRHLPGALDRAASDALLDRLEAQRRRLGYGLWAVEVPGVAGCIGFVGLKPLPFDEPPAPAVEVGWRLAREHWGRGYATEGARAALAHGFGALGLEEVVSMTVPANTRSRAVMERLGMHRDPGDDFEHPGLPVGHPLRPHVLYRLRREEHATG